MIVHTYALCFNEEVLLPYFLRHYGKASDRIVIYDNGSTDRSIEIIKASKAELRPFDTGGEHKDRAQTELKSTCYHESRGIADWVIVVDMDEFLWHPDFRGLLEKYSKDGITFPKVAGYDMVSPVVPSGQGQIYDEIQSGLRNSVYYDKREVFHPSIDINFSPGCHLSYANGNLKESAEADVKLLHYRYLGPDYFTKRYSMRMARISLDNVENGWGTITPPEGFTLDSFLRHIYQNDLAGKTLEKVV
jgi:glycosyltransferase involved in cell wall biosynthesis